MSIRIEISKNTLVLSLTNDKEDGSMDDISDKILNILEDHSISHIDIVGTDLKEWDTPLLAAVLTVIQKAKNKAILFKTKKIPSQMQQLLDLALTVDRKPQEKKQLDLSFLEWVGTGGINTYNSAKKGLNFIGQTLCSVGRFVKGTAVMRPIDFLFALENAGWKALGIVSLISFMVGLILAFVGAVQLKLFGAQIYVASLVTIAMTRIMGAIMMGIIMAGRTGASYAATIGTMQVNEEIDALKTMGIPVTDFLVLPRFLALIITMPFLTMWAD
ncbi:MAG: ABC transporter permease, partial [Alphaproteobacteria bacterium]|nr:ABC transporter permease [Alphaproteobacteria bacterium]